MAYRYTLDEAKQNLRDLLHKARSGYSIVIDISEGEAVTLKAKSSAYRARLANRGKKAAEDKTADERVLGSMRGRIWMAPDFDAYLDEEGNEV